MQRPIALAVAVAALVLAGEALAAPKHTISRYVTHTNADRWYDLGCALGNAVRNGTRPRDAVVILAFGRPDFNGTTWGTNLPGSGGFRTLPQIRRVVEEYGHGYWVCSPFDTTLRIAAGTSNFGGEVTYEHGQRWANMVDNANAWLRDRGYSSQATAVGANDIELGWNGPTVSRRWVNGYASAASYPYYNFGDAAGCPPAGSCSGGWTQADLWFVSWGAWPAWPLPQIYREDGIQARQWYRESLWAYQNRSGRMHFVGSLTQWNACEDVNDPCSTIKNTPAQGWTQLHDALNSDSRTAQGLRWSTDISWRN